jgi:ZIP family zinc transporter
MLEAGLWAFLGQASLVLGAVLVLNLDVSPRVLGLVTGFGAGTLVAASAFELTVPAYREAGSGTTAIALAVGALTFFGLDRAVARRVPAGEHASAGIALGALLDGIPESVAIAISLVGGGSVSGAMVVAVLVSNLPEGMASTPGFRRSGWSTGRIIGLWSVIALLGAVAAAVGRVVLGDASADVLGAVQAFAAGTILTMLAAVMMPTAYRDGREAVGLAFVLGFALLAYLTTLGG